MTVYILTYLNNGHIISQYAYANHKKAFEQYEEYKKFLADTYELKSSKESYKSYGLFGDSFDKIFTSKAIIAGYKTPAKIEVRLVGRSA